jgi:hypothetical protein
MFFEKNVKIAKYIRNKIKLKKNWNHANNLTINLPQTRLLQKTGLISVVKSAPRGSAGLPNVDEICNSGRFEGTFSSHTCSGQEKPDS